MGIALEGAAKDRAGVLKNMGRSMEWVREAYQAEEQSQHRQLKKKVELRRLRKLRAVSKDSRTSAALAGGPTPSTASSTAAAAEAPSSAATTAAAFLGNSCGGGTVETPPLAAPGATKCDAPAESAEGGEK